MPKVTCFNHSCSNHFYYSHTFSCHNMLILYSLKRTLGYNKFSCFCLLQWEKKRTERGSVKVRWYFKLFIKIYLKEKSKIIYLKWLSFQTKKNTMSESFKKKKKTICLALFSNRENDYYSFYYFSCEVCINFLCESFKGLFFGL